MGGGNAMDRTGGGRSNFNGCMDGNKQSHDNDDNGSRFNNDHDPRSRSSERSGNDSNNNWQGFQDNNGYNNNNDGSFCEAHSHNNQGTPRNNQDSSSFNNNNNNPNSSSSLHEAARSNAVFKQQVATMAMNEASTSFKEMEDAFALAKEVTAQLEDVQSADTDPTVQEANAHAKKLQSVAMFKLKVSQRASEEAASAYDCYQRLVKGSGQHGGNGHGGCFWGGGGPMGMGGRNDNFH